MQRALQDKPSTSRDVSITIGDERWRLYVYGVTRVGRELFIQTALFGPRTCTAVVRVAARKTRREAAREVISLICDWLTSGDASDHVFLESPAVAAASC